MADLHPTGRGDDGSELRLEAIDQVDGRFVLRATVPELDEGGGAREMMADENLAIEITSGAGEIERDPYTNRYLLKPAGSEPVLGRAVHEGREGIRRASSEVPLGIDPSGIPDDQQRFEVAGGGACSARWELAMKADFEVNVRASAMANVVPLSEDHRELYWAHGQYYAHDPVVGLMRLTYNPADTSKIVLRRGSEGTEFFPSRIENRLFFVIDFIDLGYRGFNKEPMVQSVAAMPWPPFSEVVLAIEEPLEFYDVEEPERLLMTLVSQDMRLYDYSSLDVEQLDSTLGADGILTTQWRITNQSDERVRMRWFTLGNHTGTAGEPLEGTRLLGAGGTGFEHFELTLRVQAEKSLLRQPFSLNAVSLTDSIFAGRGQVDYRFTDDEFALL
jgi:hypothetical protein